MPAVDGGFAMATNLSYIQCLYSNYYIESPNLTIEITTILTCFLTAILSLTGVVANGLVSVAIILNKDLQIYSNLLLLLLSCNDFIVSCIAQPLYITRRVLESQERFICWVTLIYRALWNISVGLSFQAIAMISIERYFALFYPFKYKEYVTVRRLLGTALVLAGLWIVFVLSRFVGLPTMYFYSITSPVILIMITMIAIIQVKIFKLARWHHRQITVTSCSQQSNKWFNYTVREAKIAKSTAFVVGAVFLCYLPLIAIVITSTIMSGNDVLFHYYILPWNDFLVFLNSLLNPLIYCWRSRELRSAIIKILHLNSTARIAAENTNKNNN